MVESWSFTPMMAAPGGNNSNGNDEFKPASDAARRHSLSVRLDVPILGERQSVYLLPGELHASAEPCQIRTILGSCVAICLWDGAIYRRDESFSASSSREGEPALYGSRIWLRRHCLKSCCSLDAAFRISRPRSLGVRPCFKAESPCHQPRGTECGRGAHSDEKRENSSGMQVTGGTHGRKIVFNTDDGAVWCRRIGEGKL